MQWNGKQIMMSKRHMRLHSIVIPFLQEAIDRSDLTAVKGIQQLTVDMGRHVGAQERVRITPEDDVFYAIRLGRDTYIPFVERDHFEPTSMITMVILPHGDSYKIISAWFGTAAPRTPGDRGLTAAERVTSIEFWTTNALIMGCQLYDNRTVTRVCPWPR